MTTGTLWAVDVADTHGHYAPLINGTTTSFTDPAVLTYPPDASPDGFCALCSPHRAQLVTEPLARYGGQPVGYQLWSAQFGALRR